MKTALVLMVLLAVSIVAVAGTYSASALEKILPKDQPNFKPQITKTIVDGKIHEVVEFKSKLSQ